MTIRPGKVLAGYRVTRMLGRGGMGEVWAATSEPGGHEVAIKVLNSQAATKPDLIRRFEREGRIAASIRSPFVCKLLDVTECEGIDVLVFEYLAGESLEQRLRREEFLPLRELGPILDDVLEGLIAAHAAGIVHRDLKPGNIFLVRPAAAIEERDLGWEDASTVDGNPRDRAKILDFGVSKMSRPMDDESTLTAINATLGSFAYMAPEQIRGAARADARADIYALGAVAFRALSGQLPFEATSAEGLVAMKLNGRAPTLAETTGERWPSALEKFLARALQTTPNLRFESAAMALACWREVPSGGRARLSLSPPHGAGSYHEPSEDAPTEVDGPPTLEVTPTPVRALPTEGSSGRP